VEKSTARVFIGMKNVFDLAVIKYSTKGKHKNKSKKRRID